LEEKLSDEFLVSDSPHDRFVFTTAWWASTFAFCDLLESEPERAAELLDAVSKIDEADRGAFMRSMGLAAVKGVK
jgi:hypothetical protein